MRKLPAGGLNHLQQEPQVMREITSMERANLEPISLREKTSAPEVTYVRSGPRANGNTGALHLHTLQKHES